MNFQWKHAWLIPTSGLAERELDEAAVKHFLKREDKQRFVQVGSKQNALVPIYLVLESDLIATVLLSTAEDFAKHITILISPSPLKLPSYEVEMMWGPIKHHNLGHQWLRQLIAEEANELH